MSANARLPNSALTLETRWFLLFLGMQALLLTGSLLVSKYLLYLAAIGLVAGLFALGILLRPWLIIPMVVVTTGLDSTGRLTQGGGSAGGIFHLTGFHIAFMMTLYALAVNACLRRRLVFPDVEAKAPLLLLLATIAISLTYSPNQPAATVSFVRVACLILFMYMAQLLVDSEKAVATVLWSMAAVTVGGAILGAYQVITGQFHLPVKVITALGGNMPRATGMFDNPNIFATFLTGGILPLIAVLINYQMRRWKQALFLLAILVSMGGLLASFSRSNWMATMSGVVVILVLSGKLRYLFYVTAISIASVLALKEFVPFAAYIFERFISIFTLFDQFGEVGQTSSTTRIYLIIASLHMFLDHPVLGIGWRAFPKVFSHYVPPHYPFWSLVDEPHTVVTMILGELGIVGFTAFMWFVLQTFSRGISALPRMTNPYLRATLIGMIANFVAFQVSQSFNGDFTNNMFWFFTGMLFAVIRLDEQARTACVSS